MIAGLVAGAWKGVAATAENVPQGKARADKAGSRRDMLFLRSIRRPTMPPLHQSV
jgi:hypothetical protein